MSTPFDPGELSTLGDLRPGSLVDRYRKCGKPNCHCAAEEAGGHGPSWSLTRQLGGKTITKIIPVTAVPQTRQQIAEYVRSAPRGPAVEANGEFVEVVR
jgi:hypothetical protein